LGNLLGDLEQEKVAMDSFTRDEAKFLCQKFAHKIFDRADLEDRDGGGTKGTAKTFYAAASFLEMLQQFYKDEDEAEEIQEIRKRARYAKWKATTMLKAFREGRQPTPGEYGADSDALIEGETQETMTMTMTMTTEVELPKVETVSDDDDDGQPEPEPESNFVLPPPVEEEVEEGMEVELDPPPAFDAVVPPPAPPPAPSAPVHRPPLSFNPPPAAPPMPAPPTAKPQPPPPEPQKKSGGFFGLGGKKKTKASKADIADAMELTKFALSALEDKNADLAAERLSQALQTLGR
jgi:vacuolar protein sorting-associated protein VTA1